MYVETVIWKLTLVALCVLEVCRLGSAETTNEPTTQAPADELHASGSDAATEAPETASADRNVSEFEETQSSSSSDSSGTQFQNAVYLYRRLFQHKRASHIDAVAKIMSLNSYDKQHKMLAAFFVKLFEVFKESKVKLTEASFVPGDSFPLEEESLHAILENTAFLGDLALRLPDITHSLIDFNAEWKSLTEWAVVFSNDTRIFADVHAEHLSLMAQELGIIDKKPSFVNPFKRETIVSQAVDLELEKILKERKRQTLKREKREQKKKLKGPRMSVQRHTEL